MPRKTLEEIARKATEYNPKNRYKNLGEMMEDLEGSAQHKDNWLLQRTMGAFRGLGNCFSKGSYLNEIKRLHNAAAFGPGFQFNVPPERVADARNSIRLTFQTIKENADKIDYKQAVMVLTAMYNSGTGSAYELYSEFRKAVYSYKPETTSFQELLESLES